MTVLVFVPLDWAEAAALRAGTDPGPRPGAAPTAELAARTGPAADPEEVEYAALNRAGALATGTDAGRLVLAADVAPGQVVEVGDGWGGVTVSGLAWRQVSALFAEDPSAGSGADPDEEPDLLWFAPEELDRLRPA